MPARFSPYWTVLGYNYGGALGGLEYLIACGTCVFSFTSAANKGT